MSKQLTKQLLLSSNYWVLNKTIVNIFGLESAFLLSNFAEAEQMMADDNGWFYQTTDTVEKMTTLSRHKQNQCIKELEEADVLEKDVRGLPPKRYFRIKYECLTKLIVNNSHIDMQGINKTKGKESATNKESSYKESNKEQNVSDGGSWRELLDTFQNNGFGLITPNTSDRLKHLVEDYSSKWVLDALEIAIDNNKRNIAYVNGILKKWEAEGKGNKKEKADPYAGWDVY